MMNLFENLQMVKEADLKTMSSVNEFGYQGVKNFPDGEKPMISEGEYGILVIGGADGEENTIITSIYYGPDTDQWAWKLYDEQDEAIKDAKLFAKLLDDEIDVAQLNRLGFKK